MMLNVAHDDARHEEQRGDARKSDDHPCDRGYLFTCPRSVTAERFDLFEHLGAEKDPSHRDHWNDRCDHVSPEVPTGLEGGGYFFISNVHARN